MLSEALLAAMLVRNHDQIGLVEAISKSLQRIGNQDLASLAS